MTAIFDFLTLNNIAIIISISLGILSFIQWREKTKPMVAFLIRTKDEYEHNNFCMTVKNMGDVTAYNMEVKMDTGEGSFLQLCENISKLEKNHKLKEKFNEAQKDDIKPLNNKYWWEWFTEKKYYGKGYEIKRKYFVKGEQLPEYSMGFGTGNITKFSAHLEKYKNTLNKNDDSEQITEIDKILTMLDNCKFSGEITYRRNESFNWTYFLNKKIKTKFEIQLSELMFGDRLIPELKPLKIQLIPVNNVNSTHPNVILGYNNYSGLSIVANQMQRIIDSKKTILIRFNNIMI